jgi:hypothetical protein
MCVYMYIYMYMYCNCPGVHYMEYPSITMFRCFFLCWNGVLTVALQPCMIFRIHAESVFPVFSPRAYETWFS